MDNRILYPQPFIPGIGKPATGPSPRPASQPSSDQFQKVLEQKTHDVKFSSHALQRLAKREIPFGEAELNKLADAVNKAERKGAKESLVLMKEVALVVSIKNRTVITAVDGANLRDNVFTKIDSAVIISD